MASPIFHHASRAIFLAFKEREPALWLRDGQEVADPIPCQFHSAWVERSADGIAISDPAPMATFQLSDILAIDATRDGKPREFFLNDGRDKITINGMTYAAESCSADGYGWVKVNLRGFNS
jgi:hypothetical protein